MRKITLSLFVVFALTAALGQASYSLGAVAYISGRGDGAGQIGPYTDFVQFVPAAGKAVTVKQWYMQLETSTQALLTIAVDLITQCDSPIAAKQVTRHGISHDGLGTLSKTELDNFTASPTVPLPVGTVTESKRITLWGFVASSGGNGGNYNDGKSPSGPLFSTPVYRYEPLQPFTVPAGSCIVAWYYSNAAFQNGVAILPTEIRVSQYVEFTEM